MEKNLVSKINPEGPMPTQTKIYIREFTKKNLHAQFRLEKMKRRYQLLASNLRLIWNLVIQVERGGRGEQPRGWIGYTLKYKIQFFQNFLIITCDVVDKNVKNFFLLINCQQITLRYKEINKYKAIYQGTYLNKINLILFCKKNCLMCMYTYTKK